MNAPRSGRIITICLVFLVTGAFAALRSAARDGTAQPLQRQVSSVAQWADLQPDGEPPPIPAGGESDEPEDAAARPPDAPGDAPGVAHLRKLTADEINRIRYLELRAFRREGNQPDRVTVKVPRGTVDDFLLEMEGHPDFRGEATRREFRKLTPPQKLHEIARYMGDAWHDRVRIETDPEIFVAFRNQVMPLVLRGCAATGCHSPSYRDAARFGLFKDPKRSAATTYANFVMLNELGAGDLPLINRAQPENSLLLMYMLPEKDVRAMMRHPGGIALKPIYQSREALGYKRIEQWIASLRQPPPNYGVSFFRDEDDIEDDRIGDAEPGDADAGIEE